MFSASLFSFQATFYTKYIVKESIQQKTIPKIERKMLRNDQSSL